MVGLTDLLEQATFIFSVRDMRVSSQAAAVLDAIHHADSDAWVSISLPTHEIQIVPRHAGATELSDAIAHAGFDAVLKVVDRTAKGFKQTPARIPFEGFDHDFSELADLPDRRIRF